MGDYNIKVISVYAEINQPDYKMCGCIVDVNGDEHSVVQSNDFLYIFDPEKSVFVPHPNNDLKRAILDAINSRKDGYNVVTC